MEEPSEALKLRVKENQLKLKTKNKDMIKEKKMSEANTRLVMQLMMVKEELYELTSIAEDTNLSKELIEERITLYKELIKKIKEDE